MVETCQQLEWKCNDLLIKVTNLELELKQVMRRYKRTKERIEELKKKASETH